METLIKSLGQICKHLLTKPVLLICYVVPCLLNIPVFINFGIIALPWTIICILILLALVRFFRFLISSGADVNRRADFIRRVHTMSVFALLSFLVFWGLFKLWWLIFEFWQFGTDISKYMSQETIFFIYVILDWAWQLVFLLPIIYDAICIVFSIKAVHYAKNEQFLPCLPAARRALKFSVVGVVLAILVFPFLFFFGVPF